MRLETTCDWRRHASEGDLWDSREVELNVWFPYHKWGSIGAGLQRTSARHPPAVRMCVVDGCELRSGPLLRWEDRGGTRNYKCLWGARRRSKRSGVERVEGYLFVSEIKVIVWFCYLFARAHCVTRSLRLGSNLVTPRQQPGPPPGRPTGPPHGHAQLPSAP